MGAKAPKGNLTDQCALMQRAIEMYMPTTIHHWCIWHIMKKIPNKLTGYKRHEEIEQEMSHVVWKSYTKDAFDRNWNNFLTKYGLGGNTWLSGFTIYEIVEQVSNSTFNKFFVTYDVVSRESTRAKNIKRRHTHIKSSQDEPLMESKSKRFDDLVYRSHNICKFISKSKQLTRILHWAFDNVMVKMQEYQGRSNESVKFQLLQCTGYELSRRGLYEF
ncbi:hypothetical protein Ahy_A09g043795 [Arachis hypogaea]|uniref:MULE transposase domain-containing protein n=1 Tax=Arachis hypogaea TaxID=3818 RepID=A0A445BJ21_ARAHY|nr:hypothetical protein Ahy_A09g043795 [Arachis hypogaea]